MQTLLAKPTGKKLQQQITAKVQAFLAGDRHDLDERQRFNGWLRTIGVRLTLDQAPGRRWQLSVDPLQKATYDAHGGVQVAGAELHIGRASGLLQ